MDHWRGEKSIILSKGHGNGEKLLPADSVLPVRIVSYTDLHEELKGKVPELYAIGDCDDPAILPDATGAGWSIANQI